MLSQPLQEARGNRSPQAVRLLDTSGRSGHLLKDEAMKFRFIAQQREAHSVAKVARILGVSRGGYYA